ncbi:MAG: peptidoglycan DD-metalloendopeptidase family protein [Solirubrobacterales bacterium]|nr:peptidoglycan DD-metalloendopeptidase family protein [Solirubrobacterales bacterium]
MRSRQLPLLPVLVAAAGLAVLAPATVLTAEATAAVPAPAAETTAAETTAAERTAQGGPAPAGPTTGAPAPPSPAPAEATPPPQVQAQRSQGSTRGGGSPTATHPKPGAAAPKPPAGTPEGPASAETRAKHPALSPSALTPSLPLALRSSISGIPSFFIESFRIPPFLLPIFQAAGTAYGVPWQVLAAINEVETDYGRDLSVSSAGAEGWMQFLPASWVQYGVDANGDGYKDPYNPADAIFAAARYLRAAGGGNAIRSAVFSYNHSQAYVDSVMLRAQLLGGTPAELLGAITGITEARFPVHAQAHFSDGFPAVAAKGSSTPRTLAGTTIYTQAGAPVIAVQDGEIVQIGNSPTLGRSVALRDAFGNTYVYAGLGDVSAVYPVLAPHLHSAVSNRIGAPGKAEAAPTGPATAGAQPRSPLSEGATVSALALGAAAALEPPPPAPVAPAPPVAQRPPAKGLRVFTEGSNDVYLHALRAGVQVIAGTVLGHVRAAAPAGSTAGEPHIIFQVHPADASAPAIDPKPILDGWVALENTSIFRAKGENPFLATSPTTGQVLLESKQQLEPQVLHDPGIALGRCGRQVVQSGRVDKRVLGMLEYLSVSGLKPTVSGLSCAGPTSVAVAANAGASASSEAVDITAINGVPVAGHQGSGSIADDTVRKLLMLQGATRPRQIVSLMSYPGAVGAVASQRAGKAIHVAFSSPSGAGAHAAGAPSSVLTPSEWIKLIARLGEIPDPTVARGPSSAAIRDTPGPLPTSNGRQSGGNG